MSVLGVALPWIAVAFLGAQGVLLAAFPQRAAAYQLWRYRLLGIQSAAPGKGTFLLYRLFGAASIAVAAFILFQFVQE